MYKHISLITLFLTGSSTFAQLNYIITSTPDSALVSLNGEIKCYTPCMITYRWRDAKNGMLRFDVSSPGYSTWSDTLTEKPWQLVLKSTVSLVREAPVLDSVISIPLVAFDKLIADLKEGTLIGNTIDRGGNSIPIKWDDTTRVGSAIVENSFNSTLRLYGYRT